ncbi:putative bifunctional diguanylate cyclase/phosphodiesterase [Pseudokineococcus sp. 1T1Z-3]|uniref:putative bifunctional diguanylate cyclase/phosphodiesterase n=1 Tax=Pseudokineococcus sp. 1T1Z-3 TaxID=3132745 RepID=UPI00309B3851
MTSEPVVVCVVMAVFFFAGSAGGLALALDLPASSPGRLALLVLVLVAVVLGGASVVLRNRLPRGSTHVLTAGGAVMLALAVGAMPDPSRALAVTLAFVFVVIDAFLFFPWRTAFLHLSVGVVAATSSLLGRGDVTAGVVATVDIALLAVAAVVGLLARRASDAGVDSLTGLPNRRGFDVLLEAQLRTARRDERVLSVALLDLDDFKAVNDAGGHAAGDVVLGTTATTWRAALPADVTLARFGGDEFAVLAPDLRAVDLAELLAPLATDAHRSASAGVVETAVGDDGVAPAPPAELVRRADAALYRAKREGRARVVVASRGVDDAASHEAALAADLERALDEGELYLHYQPLFAASALDAGPFGAEALARWVHPVRGPVPPDEFVALAERHGLVGRLGAVVLELACREMSTLRTRHPDVMVGVNVSGLELVEPGYVDRVRDVLARTGWPAHLLVLEVTESVVDADAPAALTALRAVRDLGVHVSIDDFGTGYSALSRLDRLPAGSLKLDRSFTATAHTSPERARLIQAVTAMSAALGMGVVAEGVESAEQARVLTDLGCSTLQGYHLGRPQPFDVFTRSLEGRRPRTVPPPRRPVGVDAAGRERV